MSHVTDFRFIQTGKSSGILLDGNDSIAEIRSLRLLNVRFRPGGTRLISKDVPLPLYWQQYSNHQHPERNAGSYGEMRCLSQGSDRIILECTGASQSREVKSVYVVDVSYSGEMQSYLFSCSSELSVAPGKTWRVTRNASHGELEFCNVWPTETFVTEGSKRYQNCFLEKKAGVFRIPHHHLETSDKHNIVMEEGDRFLWLLEDENPVVEVCSRDIVTAGLCAYMWDAHFALRVCGDEEETLMNEGSRYRACFVVYSISRTEGERVQQAAVAIVVPEIKTIPLYVRGTNSFSKPIDALPCPDHWPWEHESRGDAHCCLDCKIGHHDEASLQIRASPGGMGRWIVTSLGHAFGDEPFEDGKQYRLSGFVRTRGLHGRARVGLRLHRKSIGDVFSLEDYEVFYSSASLSGDTSWTRIAVTTPPISPAPDRMHLLLEQIGEGVSWFDDVLFERDV